MARAATVPVSLDYLWSKIWQQLPWSALESPVDISVWTSRAPGANKTSIQRRVWNLVLQPCARYCKSCIQTSYDPRASELERERERERAREIERERERDG